MKTTFKITKLELEIVDGVVTHFDMQRDVQVQVAAAEAEDLARHERLAARRDAGRARPRKRRARK